MIPTLDEARIKAAVAHHYRSRHALRVVQEAARAEGCEAWLFGGAIRDLVTGRTPRDLDVVLVGPVQGAKLVTAALLRAYPQLEAKLADTHSKAEEVAEDDPGRDVLLSATIEGETVDLWHVSTQRSLRDLPKHFHTAERIPKTAFLSVEAVVARPAQEAEDVLVHDAGFVETMRTGVVRARPEWEGEINQPKFAVKALSVLARHPTMRLSPYLVYFVKRVLSSMTLPRFLDEQKKRMGTIGGQLPPDVVERYGLGYDAADHEAAEQQAFEVRQKDHFVDTVCDGI